MISIKQQQTLRDIIKEDQYYRCFIKSEISERYQLLLEYIPREERKQLDLLMREIYNHALKDAEKIDKTLKRKLKCQ